MNTYRSAAIEKANCPSCNAPLKGKYCYGCGEKKLHEEEMTIRYFVGKVWNALTFTDIKFLRSISALLFKPGKLTAEFFAGRRRLYTAPLALFFFINLVYFLYQPVDALNSTFRSQTEGQPYSDWASGLVEQKMAEKEVGEEIFSANYNHMSQQISKICLIVFVFFFAIGLAIVNVKRKSLFYFHLISATHLVGFSILSMLILLPLLVTLILLLYIIIAGRDSPGLDLNMWYITSPVLAILGIYAYKMQRRLYVQGFFTTLAKTLLIIVFFIVSVILYRLFLFVFTMILI